ncbi:hypothetical protein HOY80DRAFT_1027843 [Tuber brumale]|nr:hypothetical protein HOY80DRAFT_1027843 [Tuber brumale]
MKGGESVGTITGYAESEQNFLIDDRISKGEADQVREEMKKAQVTERLRKSRGLYERNAYEPESEKHAVTECHSGGSFEERAIMIINKLEQLINNGHC